MWDDGLRPMTLGSTPQKRPDCYTLQAVVWSDAEHSKTVGPFEWCASRDGEVSFGAASYLHTLQPSVRDSLVLSGGINREGPQPPDRLLPNDRDTKALQVRNTSPDGGAVHIIDLNMDAMSQFSGVFANLRYGLGENLGELTGAADFRVWIVKINP